MIERIRQFELIGQGTMAKVYRGALLGERGTSRTVAIKRLQKQLQGDPDKVELFVNEAKLAVTLQHPHIMNALELTKDEKGYALVCEWLNCLTLESMRKRFGAFPSHIIVSIGRAICQALDYLHRGKDEDGNARIIIHRDVTPSNIFVSENGQTKLGDFGVALGGGVYTTVKMVAYTPGFGAPEQLQELNDLDARTDIYGLAETLRYVSLDMPRGLEDIINQASADDRNLRYSSALAFEEALTQFAREEKLDITAESVSQWICAQGGFPARRRPTKLDDALQSMIGEAIQNPAEQATAISTIRKRSFLRIGLGLILILSLVGLYMGRNFFHGWTKPQPSVATTQKQVETKHKAMTLQKNHHAQPSKTKGVLVESTSSAILPTTKVAPTSRKKRLRRVGKVKLNSVPWAKVIFRGRVIGHTPIRDLSLEAGPHRLEFIHPPRELKQQIEIEVKADCVQTYLVQLRNAKVEKTKIVCSSQQNRD